MPTKAEKCVTNGIGCCLILSVLMIIVGSVMISLNEPATRSQGDCYIESQNVTRHEDGDYSPSWEVIFQRKYFEKDYYSQPVVNAPVYDTEERALEEAKKYQVNKSYTCYSRFMILTLTNHEFGPYFQEYFQPYVTGGWVMIGFSIAFIIISLYSCWLIEWESDQNDIELSNTCLECQQQLPNGTNDFCNDQCRYRYVENQNSDEEPVDLDSMNTPRDGSSED